MSITEPNQQLHLDLKEAAALLKWSGVDLFGVAKRLLAAGDEISADELMMIALSYQSMEDKLAGMRTRFGMGGSCGKGLSRCDDFLGRVRMRLNERLPCDWRLNLKDYI